MPQTKVHFLTGELRAGGAYLINCGRVGWNEDVDLDDVGEFTDELDHRFKATAKRDKVTCKICRRIAGIAPVILLAALLLIATFAQAADRPNDMCCCRRLSAADTLVLHGRKQRAEQFIECSVGHWPNVDSVFIKRPATSPRLMKG